MIKLYGSPRTSAGRCYLVLEEIGVPYEGIDLDLFEKREQRRVEFLALNPNGKIPCLVDGDVTLWESIAINQYLCDRYRPELLGGDPATRGRGTQWTWWAINELQMPLIDLLIQTKFTPEARRDAAVIKKAHGKIPPALGILDEALARQNFIAGSAFTLADINVWSVVHITTNLGIATDPHAHVDRWAARITGRPSVRQWLEMRGESLAAD